MCEVDQVVIIQANAVLEAKHQVFTVYNSVCFCFLKTYLHFFPHVELCWTTCREFSCSARRCHNGSFHSFGVWSSPCSFSLMWLGNYQHQMNFPPNWTRAWYMLISHLCQKGGMCRLFKLWWSASPSMLMLLVQPAPKGTQPSPQNTLTGAVLSIHTVFAVHEAVFREEGST